ncbi:hypothetical protein JHN52_07740 [Streptomyces sp. MBT97]|uniref:hypothetical protein n=1 Tax=Streptomyces sp. MBT97 TaxID=2800411 RepID=UPI00190B55B8|nr:hypothetical protein [Streptomyces sp. MBT97]MBK3632847.1 hypothetical protein [Streptomyces sp. MBT97]
MLDFTPVQLRDATSGVDHSMNEQEDDGSANSQRDLSSFWLTMSTARSMAEVRSTIDRFDVPEGEFADRFPSLAKLVQGLPDESAPST